MTTVIEYAKQRHFAKSCGFGEPWVRWLWLDAMLYAVARYSTLTSPWFRAWCRQVDQLFAEQHKWPRSMVSDTGADCWIDAYWDGYSPQEAVDSEVSYWDE